MQRGATPYQVVRTVRLTPELDARLQEFAAAEDRRPAAFARRLIAEALARRTAESRTPTAASSEA